MFCSRCGTKNDAQGAQFCSECGTALAVPATPATPAQPISYAQPAQTYYQPPQAQPSNAKPILANLAIVLASVSVFILPIAFGPAAFILAIIALVQKQKNAALALVLACVLPVIGFLIGYSIAMNSYSGY